jgi:hypothetical protein
MSRVVLHGVVVRRVIEIVVQLDVLSASQWLMVSRLMNGFAFDRAIP